MNRTTLAAIAAAFLIAAAVEPLFLRLALIAAVLVWCGANIRVYWRRPDFIEASRMVDDAYSAMSPDEQRLTNAFNAATEAQRNAAIGACERIGRRTGDNN